MSRTELKCESCGYSHDTSQMATIKYCKGCIQSVAHKLQSTIAELEGENKELKLKHTVEICYACSKFREVPQIVSQIKSLKAELESYRWIPANKPPENLRDKPTEAAWKTWYETLDYEDEIPKAMQAEQIWLNEGSEVEYYRLLILPEQALESEVKK